MSTPEPSLLSQALERLGKVLGDGWALDLLQSGDAAFDARVLVTPPDRSFSAELLIVVKQAITPRDVTSQLGLVREILNRSEPQPVLLLVAPWISPRTQRELRDREIGYLDLTGNVSLSVPRPAIRLFLQGNAKPPQAGLGASEGKSVTLRGPRAGRLTRFLTDFAPPYRAKDIADATGVSLGWVSRLLKNLEDRLLITREGRVVVDVDGQGLLRARSEVYDVLTDNQPAGMVAVDGIDDVIRRLAALPDVYGESRKVAVTGSYAARAVAPLASGGQLMLYVDDPDSWVDELGLLPVDERADVLLLQPGDQIVYEGRRPIDGVPHVALTQVVLDCLSGPGRMPAEGDAVLEYLVGKGTWRRTTASSASD